MVRRMQYEKKQTVPATEDEESYERTADLQRRRGFHESIVPPAPLSTHEVGGACRAAVPPEVARV